MKSILTSELAVVVPTFNESDNVAPFLQALAAALGQIPYEVIFVDDDSPDGTADVVRDIALQDPRVRVLHRINRRGLASACVEGMLASSAPYIAVMDADLQHDEAILPLMLERLKSRNLDIVVGSRNIAGGSMGEFARTRVHLSMLGRRFSQSVCRCEINDPMSGFFVLSRPFLMEVVHGVSGIGFKILVDLLASCQRPVRLEEMAYRFRNRQHGESKLDILVAVEYLQLLLDKFVGNYVSASFVIFGLVGASGVVLYLAALWIQLSWLGVSFRQAQVTATLAAMTTNFLLNNAITYRDRRLRGWNILRGLILFYIACSFGVLINLETAEFARGVGFPWYAAGLIGLILSSVWNYGVTRIFTWRAIRKVHATRRAGRAPAPTTAVPEP
jgi:dolichol-phosphate mannosyltransferase